MEKRKCEPKTLWLLFLMFFKAGTFTFAGGMAMLPIIERDIVDKHKLMTKEEFWEYATLSQTLPGVIVLNCATFIGRRVAGFPGMLAAGIGSSISAFALMIVATIALRFIPQEGPAMGAMRGIRASSAALILSVGFSLGSHNLKSVYSVITMLVSFVLVFFLNVSTPLVMLAAALAGVFYYLRFIKKKKGGAS